MHMADLGGGLQAGQEKMTARPNDYIQRWHDQKVRQVVDLTLSPTGLRLATIWVLCGTGEDDSV
jgi:hypothetical protein